MLGTKLASLGTWPVLGPLAVEAGIFAFLILVVLASAIAEIHGRDMANKLVRYGFIPLILSMLLIQFVIHVVPPAVFWDKQAAFQEILGQSSRMMLAGLIAYGVSQTLNVYIFSQADDEDGQRPVAARFGRELPVADRRYVALHHHRLLRRRWTASCRSWRARSSPSSPSPW